MVININVIVNLKIKEVRIKALKTVVERFMLIYFIPDHRTRSI